MGSKKSKSTSTTNEVHKQDAQYNTLLGGADAWKAGNGFDNFWGGYEGFDSVADLNQTQQGAIDASTGGGQRLQNMYNNRGFQSLRDSLGQYNPNNTGLTQAMAAANEQSMFDFETGQMGNLRQGATDAGQYGSTRAGIAEGLARSRLAQGISAGNQAMAFQDQSNFMDRKNTNLNNLASIGQGLNYGNQQQMNAGNILQGQSAAEIAGREKEWDYQNNVPMNEWLAYKNLISGNMGGTTTGTQKTSGGGGGLGAAVGAIGGAYLGTFMGNPAAGAQIGASVGGSL